MKKFLLTLFALAVVSCSTPQPAHAQVNASVAMDKTNSWLRSTNFFRSNLFAGTGVTFTFGTNGSLTVNATSGSSGQPASANLTNWSNIATNEVLYTNTFRVWTNALTGTYLPATYQPLDTQLTDLSGLSYSGNALKIIRVNAGETGFELAAETGGSAPTFNPNQFITDGSYTNIKRGAIVTNLQFGVNGTSVRAYFTNANLSSNNKVWGVKTDSDGSFHISAFQDSLVVSSDGLSLYRNGADVTDSYLESSVSATIQAPVIYLSGNLSVPLSITNSTLTASKMVYSDANKVLTSATFGPSDVATLTGTQTLTGKTIDGNNNTLTLLAGSQLSGQVPIGNGGTGASSAAAARAALGIYSNVFSSSFEVTNGTNVALNGGVTINATGGITTTGSIQSAGLTVTDGSQGITLTSSGDITSDGHAEFQNYISGNALKIIADIDPVTISAPVLLLSEHTGGGGDTVKGIKLELNAATAPTTGDDNTLGYGVGSRWVNTTADKEYVCVDASTGAAVWKETTASAGTGTVTSVAASSDWLSVSGSPITSSGTLVLNVPYVPQIGSASLTNWSGLDTNMLRTVTNNFAVKVNAGVATNVINMDLASSTNILNGALTMVHCTNGLSGYERTHVRWLWAGGADRAFAIPSGWKTNAFSPVPANITNGTITKMYVTTIGDTSSSANQTNVYVSFEYYK